jgi:choline dehydrogenase-like flavoprotein
VKQYNSNGYWKYISDGSRWIQLESPLDGSSDLFKWSLTPVSGDSVFTIRPASDTTVGFSQSAKDKYWGYGFAEGHVGPSVNWRFTKSSDGKYSSIKIDGSDYALDSGYNPENCVHFYLDQNVGTQHWVFELLPVLPLVEPEKTFEGHWFQLTPEKAATETYDIIVIGTGMGGGVVAGDLFDTNTRLGNNAKSVLVIEKGGLAFHSHCLNAARPSGYGEDRGQQNDTFFALFRNNYKFKDPDQIKLWKGGPMFNVGGRGAAWGLFCPRIHDEPLEAKFGTSLSKEILDIWYKEAETLVELSLPLTNTIHQNVMERMNIKTKSKGCQWEWGRISSEFSESKNFDFARGAYSPIDKILEIAMSKGRDSTTGASIEHPNWKILINTEVRRILWDKDEERATGVVVRAANGKETKIFLKKDNSGNPLVDTKIVLGAGSVGSPTILMRSGKDLKDQLQNPDSNALHLTDHDIFAKGVTFSYTDDSIREKVGSMKLQSYIRLDSGKIALINFAIDSSSFLPREFLPSQYFTNRNFPKLIAAIILPTDLNNNNTIELDANEEPVVTAGRDPPFSNSDAEVQEIRDLTKIAIIAVRDALKLQLLPTNANGDYDWDDDNFFTPLELGGVAHELGTLPLKCYDSNKRFHVQSDLELVLRKGVYVCDLSIFPSSPEVNPTPTLIALALRLSRNTLLRRTPVIAANEDTIYLMNQSGEKIKVFVSNLTGAVLTSQEIADNKNGGKIMEAGDFISRDRCVQKPNKTVDESVMVYSLQLNSQTEYLPKPIIYVATPGVVCVIEL